MIWSDGCATQFRNKFVFHIISRILLGKALSWFYNEHHHDKGPMDEIGGTIKRHFRKVKSGYVIVNTLSDITDAVKKFVVRMSTVYMPDNRLISVPELIESAPSIRGTLKMHKIVRMFDNGQPYLKFFELTCDNEFFCFQKNMFQTHKRFNVIIKKP